MSFELRPYQTTMVEDMRASMRRVKRVLLQAPTGSGKGVVIAYMMRESANRGLSSWLLVHRRELLKQLSDALWKMGVSHGVIAAGRTQTKAPIQIASVQTLVRRLHKLKPPALVAIDEAHHATAASWQKIVEHCKDSWVVGLTATPCRTDGQGLGDIFDDLVLGPTVGELIEAGYLSRYGVFAPSKGPDMSKVHLRGGDYVRRELEVVVDQKAVIGDAVGHYRKYVAPHNCLAYCVSRAHARHVTEAYREAGVDAHYVAGDTPDGERERAVQWFKRGRIPVIVSVDLFGEGLDVPGLRAVQLLRPTASLGLFLQQVGRVLRVEEGKDRALILDHVGATWRHGLPDDEREWSLEGRKITKKKAEELVAPDLRHCPMCYRVFRTSQVCPGCGHQFEIKGVMPEHEDGELQEVDPEEHRRRRQIQRRREEATADTLEEWVALALERGYKPSWAGIRYAIRSGHRPKTPGSREAVAKARKIAKEMEATVS